MVLVLVGGSFVIIPFAWIPALIALSLPIAFYGLVRATGWVIGGFDSSLALTFS
jgi:hypothetical protein